MRKIILLVLAFVLLCGFGTAVASQPLQTDDAATQGLKNTKVAIGASYGEKNDVQLTEIPLDITYGLANTVDIEVILPYARWEIDGSKDHQVGFSDVTLALKMRVYTGWLNIAVKPECSIPTGDEDKGLGTGKFNYGTTLIATKQIDALTLNANVQYKRTNNDLNQIDNVWTGLISAEYPIVENLKAVAEVGLSDYKDNLILTGGFVYNIAKGIDFDVAIGQTPVLDWKIQSGLTWRF